MFGDGTFWTSKLEMAANRSGETHSKKKCCATKKEQWWQTADTCKIRAIWTQRISAADMHPGSGHTLHKWWNPMHEFDPNIDVVVNDISIGETITQANLAVKNR